MPLRPKPFYFNFKEFTVFNIASTYVGQWSASPPAGHHWLPFTDLTDLLYTVHGRHRKKVLMMDWLHVW